MSDPRHVAAMMLLVEHASAEVVSALRAHEIQSILIKGPLQQEWLATGGPPRASVDVDLLLDPADIDEASAVLAGMGYRHEPEVTPGVEHHAALWTAPSRVPVELHWTLWGTDPATTWSTFASLTETVSLDGVTVEILYEPARCVVVTLHAAHHGVGEDGPRNDLGRALIVAKRAAWERALEIATAVGAERAFAAGLNLVPEGAQLSDALGLGSVRLTERLALNLEQPVAGAPGFYWLAQQGGVRAKTRFALHKVAPPADFMRFKYPYARRGTRQLALTYLYRVLWIARWTVPAMLAWRRARAATRPQRRPRSE